MKKTTSGFTIVELLIVIVVIAILAAISVVAYNGIQDRARSTTLQNDLTNAKKKLMLYQVDNVQYPSSVPGLLSSGIMVTKSIYDTTSNNFYYCLNTATKEFALGGRTVGNKASFIISSSGGLQQAGSAVYADQICQAAGLSGYADPNTYVEQGYNMTTGWASWVKG